MKKILALALALMMVLALAACGGSEADVAQAPADAAEAPAAPAAAPADEPVADDACGEMEDASGEMEDASGEMGDASGEMGDASEDSGPVEAIDIAVNAPVIGQGASEIFAVGAEYSKVSVAFTWTGPNGEEITLDNGTFAAGDYTVSIAFKAADGYELANPINVKFVGAVGTEYQSVSPSAVDENGVPVYELKDILTIAAGDGSASGEAS